MKALPYTRDFLLEIPKSDLHLHLDGSLRIPTLIELAKARGVDLPSYTDEGLLELVFKDRYANLGEYLQGFAYTCAVMRDRESIARIAAELVADNIAEGVRYIEVRFAPQLHVHDDLDMKTVLAAVTEGLAEGAKAHNASAAVRSGADIAFESGIIACALRSIKPGMSPYYKQLYQLFAGAPVKELCSLASMEMVRQAVALRDQYGIPIVGFDLAGEEAGYPAAYHMDAYQYAHRNFMRKTVHAGEAYGPESIFQALTDCHANRIGHGTFLFAHDMIKDPAIIDKEAYVEALADYVASQRITLEVCVTSNLQTTPTIASIAAHPIRNMIAHSFSVSVCTDNRLVSRTSVTDELERITQAIPLTLQEFRNIIAAGFKGSFFAGGYKRKRVYVRQMLERFEGCVAKHFGV
ncbi:MAG: adenosine deaminase family protein [Kiritimatiellia bacterium]